MFLFFLFPFLPPSFSLGPVIVIFAGPVKVFTWACFNIALHGPCYYLYGFFLCVGFLKHCWLPMGCFYFYSAHLYFYPLIVSLLMKLSPQRFGFCFGFSIISLFFGLFISQSPPLPARKPFITTYPPVPLFSFLFSFSTSALSSPGKCGFWFK